MKPIICCCVFYLLSLSSSLKIYTWTSNPFIWFNKSFHKEFSALKKCLIDFYYCRSSYLIDIDRHSLACVCVYACARSMFIFSFHSFINNIGAISTIHTMFSVYSTHVPVALYGQQIVQQTTHEPILYLSTYVIYIFSVNEKKTKSYSKCEQIFLLFFRVFLNFFFAYSFNKFILFSILN